MPTNYKVISAPEFINLEPLEVSPFISSVDIKVFYLGKNDNGSSIDKETALKMAKTLRGNPIVGWYSEKKGDFVDHGEELILNGEGFQFNCLTQPYGFVAPDAEVWFQHFLEVDRNTNKEVDREYLMCKGYLWTGQFEEAAQAYKEGKGQSMELDNETLQGEWQFDSESGYEFFIINDANITKLCMLGDDVEPCFEGATVSASFSLSDNWEDKMHNMVNELKFALEGGKSKMPGQENLDENVQKESATFDNNQENETNPSSVENNNPDVNFDDGGDGGDGAAEGADSTEGTDNASDGTTEGTEAADDGDDEQQGDDDKGDDEGDDDEDKPTPEEEEELRDGTQNGKKTYSQEEYDALNTQLVELQEKYSALESNYNELATEAEALRTFKLDTERVAKNEKIAEFTKLTDEDKKDVLDNIDSYSLEEIESKLVMIAYRKKINLVDNSNEEDKQTNTTFNIHQETYLPDWVKAVKRTQEEMI